MNFNKKSILFALLSVTLLAPISSKANSRNIVNENGIVIQSRNGVVIQNGHDNNCIISSNSSSFLVTINGFLLQSRPGYYITSSGYEITRNGERVETVSRSDQEANKEVSTGTFNNIDIPGSFAHVRQAPEGTTPCLVCDKNFLEFVSIHNNNGTLSAELLSTKALATGNRPACTLYTPLPGKLTIKNDSHVTMDNISTDDTINLSASGSSTLAVGAAQSPNKIKLSTSGAARIVIDSLTSPNLRARLSGTSLIKINGGLVTKQAITASGSSEYYGDNLQSTICKILLSGSSDAWVHALNKLSGKVSGTANLGYKGRPHENRVKTSGCGDSEQIG